MDLLEMKHIKKEFGGLEVLKDISLRVKEGEIVSIIGPSGSGKSTLLRCATMLTEIDSGEITYMGKKNRLDGERETDRSQKSGTERDPVVFRTGVPEF